MRKMKQSLIGIFSILFLVANFTGCKIEENPNDKPGDGLQDEEVFEETLEEE